MKVSEVIVQELLKYNVNHIFGVPGVNVLPIFNEIEHNLDTELIVCSSESGAVYMADGYSRINGLGCCIGTTGPGITNMLTGVAGAYYDSTPLIVISAQVSENEYNKYAIQEMTGFGRTPNVINMIAQITKKAYRLERARLSSFYFDLRRLFKEAISARKGPVYIEICEDLWDCEVEIDKNDCLNVDDVQSVDSFSPSFKNIIDCISSSNNPLVILGNGANDTDSSLIMEFVNNLGGFCVSTALAKGKLSHSFQRYLGVIGCYGNLVANEIIAQADLIIILGASLGYLSTCGWSLNFSAKKIIRVDIDLNELKRNIAADFAINSTVTDFLHYLKSNFTFDFSDSKWLTMSPSALTSSEIDNVIDNNCTIHPVEVMDIINSQFSEIDHTIVVDVGQNAYWAERYLNNVVDKFNGFIIHGGMGAMGYGIASSIGVRLAQRKISNNAKVICICGDGGYLMNGLELNTAAFYGIDVLWIIMNNKSLGTQKAWSEKVGYNLHFNNTNNINIHLNAISQGIPTYTIMHPLDFELILTTIKNDRAPSLVNICLPDYIYPKPYYKQSANKINR